MKRFFLLIVLLLASLQTRSQSFNVRATFKPSTRGVVTLSIFESDTMPRVMISKVSKGRVSFNGHVKQPCFAEMCTGTGKKMGFFLENSAINVLFDEDNPELSAITGSRTNSQYRYALEQGRLQDGRYDISLLAAEVARNRSALFAPTIIYRYVKPLCDREKVAELVSLLDSNATKTYHYRLLLQQSHDSLSSSVDGKMPDIHFVGSNKEVLHTSNLLTDSAYNLLIVGASWCQQCKTAHDIVRRDAADVNTIVVNIDDDTKGWDSEIIRKLRIEHLPYLILIAPDNTVVARDLRAWEVERTLKNKESK